MVMNYTVRIDRYHKHWSFLNFIFKRSRQTESRVNFEGLNVLLAKTAPTKFLYGVKGL